MYIYYTYIGIYYIFYNRNGDNIYNIYMLYNRNRDNIYNNTYTRQYGDMAIQPQSYIQHILYIQYIEYVHLFVRCIREYIIVLFFIIDLSFFTELGAVDEGPPAPP